MDVSSSQVTVECYDPSDVLPLIRDELVTRLPIRDLKWKSHSRPLRQIDALHVALFSSVTSRNIQDPARPNAAEERRHQIPGLRQTPYVKVYLLRCDDKAIYKARERKHVQEWIAANSPPKNKDPAAKSHKFHDACQLLVLHIVLPGTIAASEPRPSASSARRTSDQIPDRKVNSTPWPSKVPSTVLDKLRKDFDNTGKPAHERVAQVRSKRLPEHTSIVPVAPGHVESPQEREQSWQDLIAKLKTSILLSFDLRVSQYEDDIREREAQRSLPGWNFCTFFALKEGLARGFESVGLVEDALAIYEELSLGLESIVAEGTVLLDDMSSLRQDLTKALTATTSDLDHRVLDFSTQPLDLDIQSYREKIVASSISVFEFKTYIFTRERDLLYRLGNFRPDAESKSLPTQLPIDCLHVGDVCTRAARLVTTNARILKHELASEHDDALTRARYQQLADGVVLSWTYAAIQQMLKDTSALMGQLLEPTKASQPERASTIVGGANPYPVRQSSLGPNDLSSPIMEKFEAQALRAPAQQKPSPPNATASGLVTARADLVMMQRRIVETLARQRGWRAGRASLDISDDAGIEERGATRVDELLCSSLSAMLASKHKFHAAYKTLTEQAIGPYEFASRTVVVDMLRSDLAILEYQRADYSEALLHFSSIAPRLDEAKWVGIDLRISRLYALCLKELGRKDDFIRITLELQRKTQALPEASKFKVVEQQAQTLVSLAIESSLELQANYEAALDAHFADIDIAQYITHTTQSDGFQIIFMARSLLGDRIVVDHIRLQLVSVDNSDVTICLMTSSPVELAEGLFETVLKSNVVTHGQFVIKALVLECGKIHFTKHYGHDKKKTPLALDAMPEPLDTTSVHEQLITVYPPYTALAARLNMSPAIHLSEKRSVRVEITSTSNTVQANLRLRPASAGLRLFIANATVVSGSESAIDSSAGSMLTLKALPEGTKTVLQIPYALDNALSDIKVKLEIVYSTATGEYTLLKNKTLPHGLPVDVEVHDTFKRSKMYSRFTIRTTNGMPRLVEHAELLGSGTHTVEGMPLSMPMHVLQQQPLPLSYTLSSIDSTQSNARDAKLTMRLRYRELDQLIVRSTAGMVVRDLADSVYRDYTSLLELYIEDRLTTLINIAAVERGIVSGVFDIPSFADIDWDSLVQTLPPKDHEGLLNWLAQWHESHGTIDCLSTDETMHQTLVLPVMVAHLDVLHIASLDIPEVHDQSLPLLRVGQSVKATLKLSYTCKWAQTKPTQPLTFTCTIRESQDTWLIAGQRTVTYTATEEQELRFQLVLTPIAPGYHALPAIDIQQAASTTESGITQLSCRTDYISALKRVNVLQATNSVSMMVFDNPGTVESTPVLDGTASSTRHVAAA